MFRFIIRFLKVLAIACIIGVGLRVIDVVFYKQKEDKTDKQKTSEIITADSFQESNSQPTENIVIIEEQKEEKQEEKIEIKENKEAGTITAETKETIKQETKQETTNTQTEIRQEQKPTSQIIENKQEEQQEEQKQQEEIKKEDGKVEEQEPVKEEKQEEIKVEEDKQEQIITEEYKINEQMINKIKSIIENNETADMKTYGYEIVVDSTIPELTNEFTFTEQRVINKITWKCGIIKIYARDYYFNGNYISTQCFII